MERNIDGWMGGRIVEISWDDRQLLFPFVLLRSGVMANRIWAGFGFKLFDFPFHQSLMEGWVSAIVL